MSRRRVPLAMVAAVAMAGGCAAHRSRPAAAPSTIGAPTVTAAPTATAAPTVTATVPPAAATAGAPGTCPPEPPLAEPRPDRPRYIVHAAVDMAAGAVTGDLSVTFAPDLPTDRLVFRLWPNGPTLTAAGAHLEPGPVVSVDGRALPPVRPDPTTLAVPVPGGIAAGWRVVAALSWRLQLAGPVNDRVSRVGDAVRMGSFFPLLSWEPGVGWATEPPTALHGEAATSPAADFDLTVGVPPGSDVVATGMPSGPGHWLATAVPDLAVAIGHFRMASATVDGPHPVAVTVVADASVGDAPEPYLAKAERVIRSYRDRFGPYPWPSYTLALLPAQVGGIEYPMLVFQGPGSLGRSTSHELGHQWFYALVTDDQGRDPWLDEGLATWAEAGFEGSLGPMLATPVPPGGRGRAGEPMSFWEGRGGDYYLSVYVQTAQALAALGSPDLVDCALRHYVARHAYRIARPADLVGELAAVFPHAAATLAPFGLHG